MERGGNEMSEKTHAEIIAEMRRRHFDVWVSEFRSYADRLEAAHKREIDEAERRANHAAMKNVSESLAIVGPLYDAESVGDCAKLREALSKSCAYFAVVLNAGMFNRVHLEALLNMAKAALAAPPRNCDRYPTFNDAIRALADKRGWHDAKWDSERYCILAQWLYAPAMEKEGGNDEDN